MDLPRTKQSIEPRDLLLILQDPPMMPDAEYPAWLWQLAEPRPPLSQLRRVEEDGLTLEQVKRRGLCHTK